MAKVSRRNVSSEDPDVHAAAALVLERERERERRSAIRERKRRRRQRKQQLEAAKRMRQSVEVIKWSVVGIATVMFVGLMLGVVTLFRVHSEVAQIERQIDLVRESLRRPMESLGASYGKQLDQKLQSLIQTAPGQEQN